MIEWRREENWKRETLKKTGESSIHSLSSSSNAMYNM
jgi:hypothetical protein